MNSGKALTNDTRHIHDLGRHIYTDSPTQLKNKVKTWNVQGFRSATEPVPSAP